jgi:hypothetical protein
MLFSVHHDHLKEALVGDEGISTRLALDDRDLDMGKAVSDCKTRGIIR